MYNPLVGMHAKMKKRHENQCWNQFKNIIKDYIRLTGCAVLQYGQIQSGIAGMLPKVSCVVVCDLM